jgi:hypothetical protein
MIDRTLHKNEELTLEKRLFGLGGSRSIRYNGLSEQNQPQISVIHRRPFRDPETSTQEYYIDDNHRNISFDGLNGLYIRMISVEPDKIEFYLYRG